MDEKKLLLAFCVAIAITAIKPLIVNSKEIPQDEMSQSSQSLDITGETATEAPPVTLLAFQGRGDWSFAPPIYIPADDDSDSALGSAGDSEGGLGRRPSVNRARYDLPSGYDIEEDDYGTVAPIGEEC